MLTLPSALVPSQFLRRVASTPNTKAALDDALKGNNGTKTVGRSHLGSYNPSSPAAKSNTTLGSTMSISTTTTTATTGSYSPSSKNGLHLNIPKSPNGSALDLRRAHTFRRTYSSNSIKKKTIEVTPSSFVKIRLLGKGDVGKVYLVRQKDTERLYAMKGGLLSLQLCCIGTTYSTPIPIHWIVYLIAKTAC